MAHTDRIAYNEYMREYMLRRYHERRARAIQMLGGRCSSCQRTDDLQFDHIDFQKKSFNVSKLWSISEQRFLDELKKCQLLCGDCHRTKTKGEGSLNRKRHMACKCGRTFEFTNQFAGHRRWCRI